MEPELVALAMSAATAVVGAMSTDAWQVVRSRVAGLLGRGDARAERAALETLDEDAAGLATDVDSAEARRDLSMAWSVRLRDLLRTDPDAAGVLHGLVAEMADRSGGVSAAGRGVAVGRDVNIRAASGGVAAVSIHGSVTAQAPPQAPPPDPSLPGSGLA